MTENAGATISREFQPPAGLLIDTHCHLDDDAYSEDISAVIGESISNGVCSWINVGFEPSRWNSTIELQARIPGMSIMLGIHPGSATDTDEADVATLERLIAAANAVAVGEIGLDFLHDPDRRERSIQRDRFGDQLDLALRVGLPAVIHMRAAEADVLSLLSARPSLPPLLFHSFDGGPELTDFILATDSYVGVGGLATRAKSETLRSQLRRLPLARMVLETDSPYLVPAKTKTRRNTPAQIRTIAAFLAELLQIDEDQVARQTTHNAWSFFGRLPIA